MKRGPRRVAFARPAMLEGLQVGRQNRTHEQLYSLSRGIESPSGQLVVRVRFRG